MAFASIGTFITGSSKTSGTSFAPTATNSNLTAGRLGILIVAKDNLQTTDGNTSEVTSITDAAGNTWTLLREFCNGESLATSGAVVSVWYTIASSSLTSGSAITINFSHSVGAKAVAGWVFTLGSGSTISLEGNATDLANDGADAGSMTYNPGTSKERIWLRAIALEGTGAVTPLLDPVTTNFTDFTGTGTSGGLVTSNMCACGEFRINTSTSETSNPTTRAADHASVFLGIVEVPAVTGVQRMMLLGVGV